MSQTSYPTLPAKAFAGMLADPNANMSSRSLASEDVAKAKFGLGYHLGTDPEKQFLTPAGAGVFAGALAHQHETEKPDAADQGLVTGEPGTLLRSGRIWVTTNTLVVAGEAAFLVTSVAGEGSFRNDATNAVAVAGVFDEVVDATLALLNLNHP